MAKTTLTPDSGYARELMEAGGESLKKCFQCATCSVACPMAPANNPYPRKEMVWATWGLKNKIESDPDIWLCHNCGNCAELCPRGAHPGDVMAAARNLAYKKLCRPAKFGELMSSRKGLPILFAIPAVLWLIVWAIRAACVGEWFPRTEDGRIVFGQIFYGDYTIDPIFMITFFGALFILWKGCSRLWKSFEGEGKLLLIGPKKPWYYHLAMLLWDEIVTHRKFDTCQTGPKTGQPENSRKVGHMFMIAGFVALAVTTAIVAGGHWIGKVIPFLAVHTPMPTLYPIKILANVGAICLLVALVLLTIRRRRENPKFMSSSYQDWYLLGIIWAVALTGCFSQFFRLVDAVHCAYLVYYLHLVFVWMLFAYLPWSKLAHLAFRTCALLHARMYGRG